MTLKKFPLCSKDELKALSGILTKLTDEEVGFIKLALSKAYEQGLNSKIDVCPSDCVIASALNGKIAQLERDAIQQKVNYRKALENAKEQGKLELFKEVEQLICGTSTIDALEGGVIGLDCYYLNADKFNRLKSHLSKSKGAK
jgi:hypothetical protein